MTLENQDAQTDGAVKRKGYGEKFASSITILKANITFFICSRNVFCYINRILRYVTANDSIDKIKGRVYLYYFKFLYTTRGNRFVYFSQKTIFVNIYAI